MMKKMRPLLPFVLNYRRSIFVLGMLLVVASVLEGVGIGLFFPLLDYIQKGDAFLSGRTAQAFFSALAWVGVPPSAGFLVACIFLVITLTALLKLAGKMLAARVYNPIMQDVRQEAFRRIVGSHLSYFHAGSSARLTQTIEFEADLVGIGLSMVADLMSGSLSLLVYVALLCILSWKLTLVVAVLAALRYGAASLFLHETLRLGTEHAGLRTRLKAYLLAVHQGIDVIKTCGMEKREEENFRGLTSRVKENANAQADTTAKAFFFESFAGDGLFCVFVYLAIARLHVSGTALLTFLVVVSRAIPKISLFNNGRIFLAECIAKINELPEVLSSAGPRALLWGGTLKTVFQDRVVFDRVCFTYPGATEPALDGISLVLAKDQNLAVVGASGSGKTTLARLLLRLFDPTSGVITIDGVPLPDLRQQDWTRLVAVVGQDAFIFDDTLEGNVRYGVPAATEEQFRRALRFAHAEEFVEALPDKEKTRLGERGVLLSGGQRQRIAIARAFLRDAPILILDEATSALDAETEKLIQDSVQKLSEGRTMVVIAHRFATIRNAGRIVVLEKGRIAEMGTHDELMGKDRFYRKYRELQLI